MGTGAKAKTFIGVPYLAMYKNKGKYDALLPNTYPFQPLIIT